MDAHSPANDILLSSLSDSTLDSEQVIHLSVVPSKLCNLQDLKVTKHLGHGASGFVLKVVHIPSGETMALKVISMTAEAVSRPALSRELNTLFFAEHPCFLDFYGATLFVGSALLCS